MKAIEIHSIGLYGGQRKLLVIIRNYRALKNKQTDKKPLGSYVQNKTTKKKLKVSDIKWYKQTGHIYSNTAVVD